MKDKQNILVVDDETIITNLLQTILEMADYKVTVFNDPKKALEYYLNNTNLFQLAIIDFQMPRLNGLELTKKIREKNPHLPVMMLTAYSNPFLINNAADLNICEYIVKPFRDVKSFTVSVRKNIGQSGIENRLDDFYHQFKEIMKLVLNDRPPQGLTSVSFIIKSLESHHYDSKKLEVLKRIQPYLMEQIKFLEVQESYFSLKQDSDQRKTQIKKFFAELGGSLPGS